MRNRDEVIHAFTPVGKLDEVQKQCMMKIEMATRDLATDIIELVPDCADRISALRKLLEAKFNCVQAITHVVAKVAPNGKNAKNA